MAAPATVQRFNELTKATGTLKESDLAEVYDKCPAIASEQMIGKWKGGSFDTGHSIHKTLDNIAWAGKDFRSVNDVDPMMVYNSKGEREWDSGYGHAQLRDLKFRGVVSAAMIYDKLPIIDSFRAVSDGVVIGAMDTKELAANEGTYYFYLTKLQ